MARAKRRAAGGSHSEPVSSLRIIGGDWRSRRVTIADRPGLRPTPDRVRETLFNWLAPCIEGARCGDLFAGTGALGLEALSRGAEHVVFIESDGEAVSAINTALTTLDAAAHGQVIRGDATQAGAHIAADSLDIVFIDPPFSANLHGATLAGLARALRADARLYLEYPFQEDETIHARLAEHYEILKTSRAGSVGFCLARPRAASSVSSAENNA